MRGYRSLTVRRILMCRVLVWIYLSVLVDDSCCGIYHCSKSLRHQVSISTKSTCDIKYDFMHRWEVHTEKGTCISLVAVYRNSFVQ